MLSHEKEVVILLSVTNVNTVVEVLTFIHHCTRIPIAYTLNSSRFRNYQRGTEPGGLRDRSPPAGPRGGDSIL